MRGIARNKRAVEQRVGTGEQKPSPVCSRFNTVFDGRGSTPRETKTVNLRVPGAVLLKDPTSDRWRIDLQTLPDFRAAMGDDVICQFACCFVHADRLTSLRSLFHLSTLHYGQQSVAFRRDFETMSWFSVGTLRELARSLRGLRSALAKRARFDPNSPAWLKLREVEARWEDDPFFREMRSKVAFHVDPNTMQAGLTRPATEGDVTLVEGEGTSDQQSSLRLGIESLVMGTGLRAEEFTRFFEAASADHGIGPAIQEAFIEAATKSGLRLSQREQSR